MSVAKLKEEGNKALDKKDYNAAIEFYNMVRCCTIHAPDARFCSPTILISFHLYPLQWHYLMFFFLDARANYILFLFF
jgi:hypothetical protein